MLPSGAGVECLMTYHKAAVEIQAPHLVFLTPLRQAAWAGGSVRERVEI